MIKTEKLVYGSANSSVQFEGSISYEDSFDTPVSYTHLTLPTNREV